MKHLKKALHAVKHDLKHDYRYAVYSFIALLAFFVLGYMFPGPFSAWIDEWANQVVQKIAGKSLAYIIFFIIWHNLQVNFIILLSSITVIFPLFALATNGFIIGAVARQKVIEHGGSVFLRLLPHGVFEIPAICLSFGFAFRAMHRLYSGKSLKSTYLEMLWIFLLVIMPLLIIAGIIEGSLIYHLGSSLK